MKMCGKMTHGGHAHRPDQDVVTFEYLPYSMLGQGPRNFWEFLPGTPLMKHPVLGNKEVEVLGPPSCSDPTNYNCDWTGMMKRINLKGMMDHTGTWFSIDDVNWPYGMGSSNSFPAVPASARHAKLGDLIVFEDNHSGMNHPFHLHGFSFQPMHLMEMHHGEGWMLRWDYETVEFLDTFDIPPPTSLFAKVRLDDLVGGEKALGRWLFHCHIAVCTQL